MKKSAKTNLSSGHDGNWFDEDAANRAVHFFDRYLGLANGAPILLDFQRNDILRPLFGWKRPDGTRQYRTAYVSVAKKNAKTTLGAGIGLYMACADGERASEVYCAAGDRDQADLCFTMAKQMVEDSSALRKRAEVFRRSIVFHSTRSVFKVLSADARTKHGPNPHGIIFDELHVQPNRELWDTLTAGRVGRRQPLVVALTTAGYDQLSICYEIYHYARQVLNGTITDPSFFAYIREVDEKDDWRDRSVWQKANPALGITVNESFLEEEAKKAELVPAYQNTFRRLHLNQWTSQSSRFIDMRVWGENAGPEATEDELVGRRWYGGLDMSTSQDLTAWVMVSPDEDDPEAFTVLCRFWVPEARLNDPSNRYRADYQAWARDGWLRTTPGEAIDYSAVRHSIIADFEKFHFVEAAVDVNFQGYEMFMELQKAGLPVLTMRTGTYTMSPPTKELERRLILRKVRHRGDPVLRWNADNVTVKTDHLGNIVPDRASSQGKIDGFVALVMAVERLMRHERQPSVYETRGIREVGGENEA